MMITVPSVMVRHIWSISASIMAMQSLAPANAVDHDHSLRINTHASALPACSGAG
ncbi:hypothetical protein [Komagataeibacter sp. FNDCF1]|uniref:hypothetical protein n=1 Tax=Komagataeibacter sp. FNDCF1 TaxID=2878681 RepID=UPI001E2A115E|nr:hypothetical protein [Komagataeibacter sp. FNDCF1]MCE2565462.1 hypothetical protein [Komagataeibacter sp. FNDCF1]